MNKKQLKQVIEEAFTIAEYPGDWCLKRSNEGFEPEYVVEEFTGKTDWRKLDPEFLDQAPQGLASALSFFSDEAFHFYLPAYLLADVDGHLRQVNVVFHLTHGLTNDSMSEKINPRRYGERTWYDDKCNTFAMFNVAETRAISAFLKFKLENADLVDFERDNIKQALENYWKKRAS